MLGAGFAQMGAMKTIALLSAVSLCLVACGPASAFDQCEAQRTNYSCGTTRNLVIDCAQFKTKTCNTASMERWLTCVRAAHKCTANGLDVTSLTSTVAGCGFPDCTSTPTK